MRTAIYDASRARAHQFRVGNPAEVVRKVRITGAAKRAVPTAAVALAAQVRR